MTQTTIDVNNSGSFTADADERAALARLFRHQRRLIYGGGWLLTLLIVLTLIGNCLMGVRAFHQGQENIFEDARSELNEYLLQRTIARSARVDSNNALWSERHDYLVQSGAPFVKQFMEQGQTLEMRLYPNVPTALIWGRNAQEMSADRLAAYFGLFHEYASYVPMTVAQAQSSYVAYAYDPSHYLQIFVSDRAEAQLPQDLHLANIEAVRSYFRALEQKWDASASFVGGVTGKQRPAVQFFFANDPLSGKPSLAVDVHNVIDGDYYLRLLIFEPIARVQEQLQPFLPNAFVVIDHRGAVVATSGITALNDKELAQVLRDANLWSNWPDHEVTRREGGQFIIADRIKNVDWSIVNIYSWRDIVIGIWPRLALSLFIATVILSILWLLLRRIDKRVFAPAMQRATRVYESEQLNRVIIDTSPVGLCLLDRSDAGVVMQNHVMRIYATDVLESGKSLYRELMEQSATQLALEDAAHGTAVEFQLTTRQHEGGRRDFLVAAVPTRYHTRHAVLFVLRDLTARVELEKHLEQARLDSESARRAAESASRAKSSFVATMSHEIRTPLNGMLGHLELLTRSPLDSTQRERLDRIRVSADSLLTTITDVLDFSRIEAGQLDIDPISFHLRNLIEQVALLFAPSAQRKGLKLYIAVDRSLDERYVADSHRLQQILNNLVSNAVKFTDSGRVIIRVTRAASSEPVQAAYALLRFEVIDSGIGLSEAQIEQLFQPFVQADASISRRFGGSGLGLNLCKQLSELLGGSIKVQSTLGAGSIFSVQIPLAQDVSSQPLKSPELAGKRIALLSSAVEWRNEISELLSSWNVTVVTGAEPRALDPAFVRSADALLFFGMQRTWDEDEEQQLVAHAKRVIRAYMDGPLQPEQRDGALFISCYSSAALSMAIGSETGHIDSFVRASPLSTELTAASDKRGRVLLVDDNAVNRELIAQQLEALGMASDAAEDGEIALRMWREDTYVAVLTDINMPNMDGYQLAQCLRDRGVTVPILAITARALPSEKVRSKEVGMTDLLLKPISLEQLDAALSRSLAKLSVANADADEKSRSRSKFPHKIRGIFVESGTRDLQNILLAWRDRESPAVLQRLHSLKGALLMLGESSVADSCAAVEKAVEMSGLDAAQAELAQLEAALRDLLADYARPETP